MSAQKQRTPSTYQRNALAPSLIAAATLFVSPALLGGPWNTVVLFLVSILALIVGWFGIQAKQWWWAPVFVAIAVEQWGRAPSVQWTAVVAAAVLGLAAGAHAYANRATLPLVGRR